MKQQLLQDRETLISHLEEKVQLLRQARNQLMNQQNDSQANNEEHVNVGQYLKQQNIQVNPKKKQVTISAPKIDNFVVPVQPVRTKADILREQKQTKQKLAELELMYKRKRELQSIGIYEKDTAKIKGMYSNKDTKNKIQKKVQESKKKQAEKIERDKIIKEQLQKVQNFLNQGKQGKKKIRQMPQNHYSRLIQDKRRLTVYDNLIKKPNLTLTQKQQLLECTFQILKEPRNMLPKEKLKIFMLSNPELCEKFYITKTQIMRDLQVYSTNQHNNLTYQQFYQFVKSIEITNKALKPNMNYKIQNKIDKKNESRINNKNLEEQENKQMEKYLKNVFSYFDSKYQRIIDRQKFEIALKKALLYDEKKYKCIKRPKIIQFGDVLSKRKDKINKRNYYKTLDIKYIGLDQIIDAYRKFRENPRQQEEQQVQNQTQEEPYQQFDEDQIDFSEKKDINQASKIYQQQLPNPKLQDADFDKYGWSKQVNKEQFESLKQIDKYYKQMADKYGNQIHWNGFQHYQEDFSNFNKLIKKMNEEHTNEK